MGKCAKERSCAKEGQYPVCHTRLETLTSDVEDSASNMRPCTRTTGISNALRS
ncbi:hypothetical protein M408DRAFT_30942 [Serendipita vermifera MAFF 305830]|uniref:Uncharacterized protein n=1 Tax=Serendipita vermifera MAFF 305830 TaxID=933852 RepID=A0A0C2VZP8_SERVB|nr:hypothetical protein M408DRAFT_30942 [Serendipita vermifera MAFF 305830]